MLSLLRTGRALATGQGKVSTIVNAMTVDVEEYFTVQNLAEMIPRDRWPAQSLRSDDQTRCLLDLFDSHGVKGTFFVLGWVADRHRSLVREIHDRGHEVAAHSYWHRPVYETTPEEFRTDLRRVRDLLADLTGAAIVGYRAPTYSVTRASLWAHEILAEEGFQYSSSIFPIVHDRYGISDYARFTVSLRFGDRTLHEMPLTTLRVAGKNLPVAGGGYLRLLPARTVAAALASVNNREHQPAILYLHPWEIDPAIPKYRQGWLRDTRGYLGLDGMLGKLDYLLSVLHFGRMDEVLARSIAAGGAARA